MTEIWRKDGDRWSTIKPIGFANEDELHSRIVEAPELLPLSGQPLLATAFREVRVGGGNADVLAFSTKGRPVIIEVKLSTNPEAKRAVVAQTLAYAAGLHGSTIEKLEGDILGQHLGGKHLADAIEEAHPTAPFDRDEFYENLSAHLETGKFRLVIVLDDAPRQLVRLMGYLETITTDQIVIDLVQVSSYEVNGAQILVTQRIDPSRESEPDAGQSHHRSSQRSRPRRGLTSAPFRRWLDGIDDVGQAAVLLRVVDWADGLVEEKVCQVQSTVRKQGRMGLTVWAVNEESLAVLDTETESGEPRLWLRGPNIAKYAPDSLFAIQQSSGQPLDKDGHANAITPELLDALADAYREAAGTA